MNATTKSQGATIRPIASTCWTHTAAAALILGCAVLSSGCGANLMRLDMEGGLRHVRHDLRQEARQGQQPSPQYRQIVVNLQIPEGFGCLQGADGNCQSFSTPTEREARAYACQALRSRQASSGVLFSDHQAAIAEVFRRRLEQHFSHVTVLVNSPQPADVNVQVSFVLRRGLNHVTAASLTTQGRGASPSISGTGTTRIHLAHAAWAVPTAVVLMPIGTIIALPIYNDIGNARISGSVLRAVDASAHQLAQQLSGAAPAAYAPTGYNAGYTAAPAYAGYSR